jgi:aldehyde dehydrogenase (NAD+)
MIDTFAWETDFPARETFGFSSLRMVRYEPYGVVAAITAWNAPAVLNLWKSVPALAAGNTVVLKTAPETPLVWCAARPGYLRTQRVPRRRI